MSFLSPRSLLLRQFIPILRQYAVLLGTENVVDFGPAFLPPAAGLPIMASSENLPANGPIGLGVSCFALSELNSEELSKHVMMMHRASSFVMLADFKVPERNLELPACLLMRGIRISRPADKGCFKKLGGLEGLLYAKRELFAVKERHSLLGGALMCVLVESLH